ncbi:Crp/Fnr family transcriptional regulator [Acidimangrovimonas pyrenivorans]|uniref:Crp/Fnr family transcriptional regulator n=1 Tax=Acidimangrovimonas pyrenivorans TaxID=2030798 RepID=A0ABV7AJK6_9RHOB
MLARLLAQLPADIRRALAAVSELRDAPAGTVMIADGAPAEGVGLVLEGTLGLIKRLPDGRSNIIGLLTPGELCGRVFDPEASYQVEALTDARVLCFKRAGFEEILEAAPEVERLFMINVLDEIDAAREWLLLLGGRKAVERVASFLLILCRQELARRGTDWDGSPIPVRLPLSRADLARHLGTRPETLSRALHALEDRGVLVIHDPGRFEVTDPEGLVNISGHDLLRERCG